MARRRVQAVPDVDRADADQQARDLLDHPDPDVRASLAAGNERMAALEEGHREIKGMLSDTLDRLTAGNPEVRP